MSRWIIIETGEEFSYREIAEKMASHELPDDALLHNVDDPEPVRADDVPGLCRLALKFQAGRATESRLSPEDSDAERSARISESPALCWRRISFQEIALASIPAFLGMFTCVIWILLELNRELRFPTITYEHSASFRIPLTDIRLTLFQFLTCILNLTFYPMGVSLWLLFRLKRPAV